MRVVKLIIAGYLLAFFNSSLLVASDSEATEEESVVHTSQHIEPDNGTVQQHGVKKRKRPVPVDDADEEHVDCKAKTRPSKRLKQEPNDEKKEKAMAPSSTNKLRTFRVEVSPNPTPLQIKKEVKKNVSVKIGQQSVVFDEQSQKNDEELDLKPGDTIYVVITRGEAKQKNQKTNKD